MNKLMKNTTITSILSTISEERETFHTMLTKLDLYVLQQSYKTYRVGDLVVNIRKGDTVKTVRALRALLASLFVSFLESDINPNKFSVLFLKTKIFLKFLAATLSEIYKLHVFFKEQHSDIAHVVFNPVRLWDYLRLNSVINICSQDETRSILWILCNELANYNFSPFQIDEQLRSGRHINIRHDSCTEESVNLWLAEIQDSVGISYEDFVAEELKRRVMCLKDYISCIAESMAESITAESSSLFKLLRQFILTSQIIVFKQQHDHVGVVEGYVELSLIFSKIYKDRDAKEYFVLCKELNVIGAILLLGVDKLDSGQKLTRGCFGKNVFLYDLVYRSLTNIKERKMYRQPILSTLLRVIYSYSVQEGFRFVNAHIENAVNNFFDLGVENKICKISNIGGELHIVSGKTFKIHCVYGGRLFCCYKDSSIIHAMLPAWNMLCQFCVDQNSHLICSSTFGSMKDICGNSLACTVLPISNGFNDSVYNIVNDMRSTVLKEDVLHKVFDAIDTCFAEVNEVLQIAPEWLKMLCEHVRRMMCSKSLQSYADEYDVGCIYYDTIYMSLLIKKFILIADGADYSSGVLLILGDPRADNSQAIYGLLMLFIYVHNVVNGEMKVSIYDVLKKWIDNIFMPIWNEQNNLEPYFMLRIIKWLEFIEKELENIPSEKNFLGNLMRFIFNGVTITFNSLM